MTTNSVNKERLAEIIEDNTELSGQAEAWGSEVVSMARELLSLRTSSGGVTSGEVVNVINGLKSALGLAEWGSPKDAETVLQEIIDTWHPKLVALSSLHAQTEAEAVWGYGDTVGNLIAQLRTFDLTMPIHAGFHADLRGKRQAMVRGLTLSRERVNGRKIETGNEDVPYSAVIWSAPKTEPTGFATGDWHMEAVYEQIEELQQAAKQSDNEPMEALFSDVADMCLWLLAQLQAVERERGQAQQAVDAFSEICVELGVERDNEAGLAAAAELKASLAAAREALTNIRELNLAGEDENGHRWANSDLIEQEIRAALAGSNPK